MVSKSVEDETLVGFGGRRKEEGKPEKLLLGLWLKPEGEDGIDRVVLAIGDKGGASPLSRLSLSCVSLSRKSIHISAKDCETNTLLSTLMLKKIRKANDYIPNKIAITILRGSTQNKHH